MAVKMKVLETHDVDVNAGTDELERLEIDRTAGNKNEFRQAAIAHVQEKFGITYFEVVEKACIYATDDRLIAETIS